MEEATLTLSKEDRDFLIAALRNLPIRGTIETLPEGLEKIMALMKKIQDAFEVEQ